MLVLVLVMCMLLMLWHPSLQRMPTVCSSLESKRHQRQPTATAAASHQQTAVGIAKHGQEAWSTPFKWKTLVVVLVVAVLRHHHQTAAPTCRATPITVAMMLLPRTMPVASCTRHMLAAAALRRKRTLRLQLLQNPMLLYMLSRSTTLTSAALVIRAGSITMQIRPMRHIIRSPMLTLTT